MVAGIDGVELFVQQHKEILSGLSYPEKPYRWNGIFPSECGLYDGRKSPACDTWPGNAKVKRRSGKGWRGTDRRKTPDRTAQTKTRSLCGCDRGRRIVTECAIYQYDKRKWAGSSHPVKRWKASDLLGFEIENCLYRIRVVKYHEMWLENGKEAERWMWLVTTLEQTAPEILWEMMNRRWDIEENGFHQLKTYYHAKHCYCHAAVEVIFNLMIIGFNMRELYLYRRLQKFARSRITRKSVSRMFRDDLLTEKVKHILYQKGG